MRRARVQKVERVYLSIEPPFIAARPRRKMRILGKACSHCMCWIPILKIAALSKDDAPGALDVQTVWDRLMGEEFRPIVGGLLIGPGTAKSNSIVALKDWDTRWCATRSLGWNIPCSSEEVESLRETERFAENGDRSIRFGNCLCRS